MATLVLLAALCFAQEPVREFSPVPFDASIEGALHLGILVDETTFAELGKLRVDIGIRDKEIAILELSLESVNTVWTDTVAKLEAQHSLDMTRLQTFYDARLDEVGKRTFWEKNGTAVGLASGFALATVLGIAMVAAYGQAFSWAEP